MGGKAKRVTEVVAQVVEAAGYDLEDVSVQAAGRRRQIIVVVDGDVVDVDDLAEMSREISARLDDTDAMGDSAYTLEVTSRGVGRPLTLPRHWRRNAGRLVAATLLDGTAVEGRIGPCDDVGVEIGAASVPYRDIARAVVQVEFSDKDEAKKADEKAAKKTKKNKTGGL